MDWLAPAHARGEALVFVPNWIQPGCGPARLSHLLLPMIGSLHCAGWRVRLVQQAFDGAPRDEWLPWLDSADVAIAWCAEMYPAVQIDGTLAFARLCEQRPRLPLALGGGFLQLLDPATLEVGPRIDAIVTGPGEVVVPALAAALQHGAPLSSVPGILHGGDGRWTPTAPARRGPLDPASLVPLYELDLRPYLHAEPEVFDNDAPSLQIHTGSGCAKHCPFCFDEHTPPGLYPAGAIVDALAMLASRYELAQVLFGELDFFHRLPRALEIADGITARGLALRWFALGSVADLARASDVELARLALSGCARIELGSESGSDAQLERLGKRHRAADVATLVARLADVGIATTHNLLFGAPGETRADRDATLRLAFEIEALDARARLHFRSYQVLPSTTTGREVAGLIGALPRSLEQLRAFRYGLDSDGGRALPWLSERDERDVEALTAYLGPLSFRRGGDDDGWIGGALRGLARLRCRSGWRGGTSLERRASQRAVRALPDAYVP